MREEYRYEVVVRLCRYKWKLFGTRIEYEHTKCGTKYEVTIYILIRK